MAGTSRDYLEAHPEAALLIVEVADTTLAFARRGKGSVYARAGIAEYWVVNVSAPALEVHREPGPDPPGFHELTWAPDGRAVFSYGDEIRPGEPHIVWYAVGAHEILP